MLSAVWQTCSKTTLAAVAPGIAEALVATAVGLLRRFQRSWPITAIRMISIVAIRFETFIEEFRIFCNVSLVEI